MMIGVRAHDVFFCAAAFFLAGVFFESIGWKFRILILFTEAVIVLTTLYFASGRKIFLGAAFLAPVLFLGALYQSAYQTRFLEKARALPFNREVKITGIVASDPVLQNLREFKLRLIPPLKGQILVRAARYPKVGYGDTVQISGAITKPKGNYRYFLMKEEVAGLVTYPRLAVVKAQNRSLQRFLFSIRKRALSIFQRTLPYEEAAFLGGITLGGREALSEEFKTAMARSGTAHLVALSGYNITIIVAAGSFVLGGFLSRAKTFIALVLLILAFVAMTGAEASVVRAALVGAVAALAPLVGRIYAPRNGITLAALAMTLENPNLLAYDLGFQLSFLALIGIVYLKPKIHALLRFGRDEGLFGWKTNFTTTTAAQLAVAPVLLSTFGRLSLTSILANVVILETIPVAMLFGFVLAVLGLFSYSAALMVGWLALLLLKFQIAVIYFFSKFSLIVQA